MIYKMIYYIVSPIWGLSIICSILCTVLLLFVGNSTSDSNSKNDKFCLICVTVASYITAIALGFLSSFLNKKAAIILSTPIIKSTILNLKDESKILEANSQISPQQKSQSSQKDLATEWEENPSFNKYQKNQLKILFESLNNLPSRTDVVKILSQKAVNNIHLANSQLQPIAFAIKLRPKTDFAIGLFFEIVAWIGLIPILFILGVIHHFDFTGISSIAIRKSIKKAIEYSRQARRYRVGVHNKLKHDKRAPILYLRTFKEEVEGFPENYIQKTYEERIVSEYKKQGPVIAVGAPKENFPQLGAYRLYFDDDIWRSGVQYLMLNSRLVIIHAGISFGTLWELGVARRILNHYRIRITFLSWEEFDLETRQKLYLSFKKYAEVILETKLPDFIGNATLIYFEENWKPVLHPPQNSNKQETRRFLK